MSYISGATSALCTALGHCFGGYDSDRAVRVNATTPMDDVAIVDFSITARGIEVHGSISIVLDVADWFGTCFVSGFSTASKRWLRHGPVGVSASEFMRELVAACASIPEITLIYPGPSSVKHGFRFDMGDC